MAISNLNDLNFRITIEDVRSLSSEKQDALRIRIQSDLRFLVNCVLRPKNPKRFPTLLEKVHGPIIDAFPSANPAKWNRVDEFVLMASRGMLKSTLGMAYLMQVILNDPDIRILIMSGKIEKAESILNGARMPFFSNPVIRYLFPEWAITDRDLKAESFICPHRDPELDSQRDPTISLASFESVKAGGHYELILLDDATNEINSSNIENCEKTHGTYDDTDELLEPGGIRLFLATKWHEEDLPEYIRKKGIEDEEQSGEKTVSYFVQPAWRLRTDGTPLEVHQRNEREKNGQLTPDDVILTWPEKLNEKFLFKRYRKNRADFYKQYLLDASIEETPKSFSAEVLARQFTQPSDLTQIPYHDRAVVVHWDFASAFTGRRKKSESDYSCGIICVFQCSTQRMWVVECRLMHFNNSTDAAHAIVDLHRLAWHFGEVVGHSIEDAAGVRWLGDTIDQVVRQTTKSTDQPFKPITWELPNNELNAKNARISVLASAMKSAYVYIMVNVSNSNDLKVQFEKWTIDAKRRKDDGPDCIAQAWQHYRPLIVSKTIEGLKPSGPILSWEPELPVAEALDSHADEADADKDWLSTFTAPHA